MIPKKYNNGKRIPKSAVEKWEKKVVDIGEGFTAHAIAKGAWYDPDAARVKTEDMRPVDILCQREQIKEIAALTSKVFKQKAVFYYKAASAWGWYETSKKTITESGR